MTWGRNQAILSISHFGFRSYQEEPAPTAEPEKTGSSLGILTIEPDGSEFFFLHEVENRYPRAVSHCHKHGVRYASR